MEPPWLDKCSMCLTKWGKLVDSFAHLALRSAALESILEVRKLQEYDDSASIVWMPSRSIIGCEA